jgi:hypothetical protein
MGGQSVRSIVVLALALVAAALSPVACSSPAPPVPVAANELAQGDPLAAGQDLFLHSTWGLEALNAWPPTEFMLGLMKSEPAVFGNQFASFGFLPDPNDDFPLGFKRGSVDPSRVYLTCASCHSARLPDGRVWLGAPNEALDVGRLQVEVDKRWVAAGNPSMLSTIDQGRDLQTGPGRIQAASDTDPLISDDIPVAYDLGKRGWLSKMGTSNNLRSEVYLSLFGFGAGYPDDQHAVVPFPSDDTLTSFVAYFGSIDPPAAPTGDPSVIARGQAVYQNAQCDSCHKLGDLANEGVVTVDANPNGLDRLPTADPSYPRGSVHTSALEWATLTGATLPGDAGDAGTDAGTSDAGDADAGDGGDGGVSFGDGFAPYIAFIVKHHLQVAGSDGYVVPDLRGLWASAPYLHNGSVGTLDDLLNPATARAPTFQNNGFTVDTTLLGNANYGHEFGTNLSSDDKSALVTYLKSL